MESPEVKKQKLIAQLVAAAQKVAGENRISKANYVVVPDKNIEAIARKFGVSVADAQQMLKDYFANQLN